MTAMRRTSVSPREKRVSPYQTFAKWACMAIAVLWAIVYRLSQQNIELPGFVYVNF